MDYGSVPDTRQNDGHYSCKCIRHRGQLNLPFAFGVSASTYSHDDHTYRSLNSVILHSQSGDTI